MRPGLPPGPDARLRVLLRTPGGLLRLRGAQPHPDPGAHRAGASHDVALRRPVAVRGGDGRGHRHGLHAAGAGRPPGPAPGAGAAVREERLPEPDLVVQGPGRVPCRHQGQGVRVRYPRLRLHRQPGEQRRRPRRPRRHGRRRLRAGRPGAGEAHRLRRLRPHPCRRRRQLRRGEPAVQRAVRQVPLGVREHQHAALLRGGQQDAGLRGVRAARLAGPGPLHRSAGQRLALHQDIQGAEGDGLAGAGGRGGAPG